MTNGDGFELLGDVRAVCDVVDSTLGPFGANKLVVEADGTVTTTAAGSAVIERLDVSNPSVELLRTGVEGFHEVHGDGASSVVTVLGGLLREANRLAELGCHPTVIERGYRAAMTVADEYVGTHARPLSAVGAEAVAATALTGTRDPAVREMTASLVTEAVDTVLAAAEPGSDVGRNVTVVSHVGAASAESKLVPGVVVDTSPDVRSMPRNVGKAGVAVLSGKVDVPHVSELDGSERAFSVDGFETRAAVGDRERASFIETLDRVVDAGCRAVFTTGGVNDRVVTMLANRGIIAFSALDEADIALLARATGAVVVPSLDDVSRETLGDGSVLVNRHAGHDMVHVRADTSPVYTLFCRAPDPRSTDAFERSVEAAVHAAATARTDGRVVPGAGAVEVGAARAIHDHAPSVAGKEQLAVEAFADGLLAVPRALARNGGLDGWTAIARLVAAHSTGRDAIGVDSTRGEIRDVLTESPVAEPAALRRAVWNTATDLAIRFLRVDEQIFAGNLGDEDDSVAPRR
ncbi:TCP-1/cpn60 chaperonin family protein [Haladaptatus sp. DYF46]|uniref:TCP-1/cpn60 chaperonin family protein n=1 Tax=Haladaptatus sp. DYF46 TaxID=2886041 RepID=UPI001E5B7FFA|nr:TCP-1/cpn60 chaperonin family protein [Haladaptatus sp. DYF46]